MGVPRLATEPQPTTSEVRERRIINVLMALQPGEVTTYGDVADVAGYPKLARQVGRILASTDADVPWWRVVNSSGRLVPGHEPEQAALLLEEEVIVGNNRVRSAPSGRFQADR